MIRYLFRVLVLIFKEGSIKKLLKNPSITSARRYTMKLSANILKFFRRIRNILFRGKLVHTQVDLMKYLIIILRIMGRCFHPIFQAVKSGKLKFDILKKKKYLVATTLMQLCEQKNLYWEIEFVRELIL